MREQQLLVEGRWSAGEGRAEVRAPYDGTVVAAVAQAGAADIEAALAFAFAGRRAVAAQSSGERREVLRGIVDGLGRRAAELTEVLVQESGKPVRAARAEVTRAIETFTLAAAEVSAPVGHAVPIDFDAASKGYRCEVRRVPAGVVVGIVPFNFALNLGAHKVAPALAVGAPIIIKPPPQAPTAQLLLAEIAQAAGAHPAALQVLPCSNARAEQLATDVRVRVLSFTGSAKVGWRLKSRVAGKALLELGGNAAVLVCADADLEWAAERCVAGGFGYAGQVCIKVQRVYVEASVYERFLARVVARTRALVTGNPADDATTVGPVIDDASAERIESWVNEAVAAGATRLTGGVRRGRLLEPMVLTGAPSDAKVTLEEVFGPVMTVAPVADAAEGFTRINQGGYGLQAAVFTYDTRVVARAFTELEVGGLIVNDSPSFRSDNFPYGGVKGSGLGREGVRYAMEELSELKALITAAR